MDRRLVAQPLEIGPVGIVDPQVGLEQVDRVERQRIGARAGGGEVRRLVGMIEEINRARGHVASPTDPFPSLAQECALALRKRQWAVG